MNAKSLNGELLRTPIRRSEGNDHKNGYHKGQ